MYSDVLSSNAAVTSSEPTACVPVKESSAGPNQSQLTPAYDIIIVGGGMVGGLAALLLADIARVLVIDAALPPGEATLRKRDSRVLAINEASRQVYDRAGVWTILCRQMPYLGMQVWNENGRGQLEFGENDFTRPDTGLHAGLGSMVEPPVLVAAIGERLQARADRIDCLYGQKVVDMQRNRDSWSLKLQNGQNVTAPLIVGADGAQSFIKRKLGINDSILDYQQIALTCAIQTQQPHRQIARQIFWPGGPIGILPMASDTADDAFHWSSVVWSVPAREAKQLMALDDAQFADELGRAMQYCLGPLVRLEARGIFPLRARAPREDAGEGWVLIGDAAHVIHPLAGQGVNLGVMDAAMLADCLIAEFERTGKTGSLPALKKYSMKRRLHTRATMHGMTLIGWFQQNRNPLMVWGRSEGAVLLQKLPLIRKKLTEIAGGMSVLKGTRYYNGASRRP